VAIDRLEEGTMKTLAFNGSPKTDKGNTTLILTPFLEGMKEAGSEVELFYIKKLKINPCQGEANCVLKHPGKCWQDDDMNSLLSKITEADFLVFASPVYCDGITGPMKNLIDRFLPLLAPYYLVRDGHLRVGVPEGYKPKKVSLVSSCGLWETDNFDPLVHHMEAFCRNLSSELAGALVRPHANMLRPMVEMGAPINDVFDAAKEAGRQLVTDGAISEKTQQTVGRELIPRDRYMNEMNEWFRQELEKSKVS
jgi:putative NADPH-quinone reductase